MAKFKFSMNPSSPYHEYSAWLVVRIIIGIVLLATILSIVFYNDGTNQIDKDWLGARWHDTGLDWLGFIFWLAGCIWIGGLADYVSQKFFQKDVYHIEKPKGLRNTVIGAALVLVGLVMIILN